MPPATHPEIVVVDTNGSERLGQLIRRLRTQSGRSVRELSASVGISAAYWRMVERGTKSPSLETLRDILITVGAQVDVEPATSGGLRPDLVVTEPGTNRRTILEVKSRIDTVGTAHLAHQLWRLNEKLGSSTGPIIAGTMHYSTTTSAGSSNSDETLGRIMRILSNAPPEVAARVLGSLEEYSYPPSAKPLARDSPRWSQDDIDHIYMRANDLLKRLLIMAATNIPRSVPIGGLGANGMTQVDFNEAIGNLGTPGLCKVFRKTPKRGDEPDAPPSYTSIQVTDQHIAEMIMDAHQRLGT